jgi:hypothetical protein
VLDLLRADPRSGHDARLRHDIRCQGVTERVG